MNQKAPVNRTHSKRFAPLQATSEVAKRLECGGSPPLFGAGSGPGLRVVGPVPSPDGSWFQVGRAVPGAPDPAGSGVPALPGGVMKSLAAGVPGGAGLTLGAMRILALDHGTKRIGVAVSDELKMIASPLEFIPAEPFAAFLERLRQILREKEVELILVGMPRNLDGSYGPAALKVKEFVAVLRDAQPIPIQTWDERLTSAQANRFLLQGNVRREERKQKVDKMAAAILLQSWLDSHS